MATADDGWEQRMSDRTAVRRAERKAEEDAEIRRQAAEHDQLGFLGMASMTLGQAVALMRTPPWACACVGGLNCCRFQYGQARALMRAAHIAVKMVSEVRP